MTDQNDANWKALPKFYLDSFGTDFLIFKMNNDSIPKTINAHYVPEFYKSILDTWFKVKRFKNTFKHDFEYKKEIIWGNKNILYEGKALIFNNWIDSGFIYLNDIIDENGRLDEEFIYDNLKNTKNWVSELYMLKNAIPRVWKEKLKCKNIVKINYDEFTLSTKFFNKTYILNEIDNKFIYGLFIRSNRILSNNFKFWERKFSETCNFRNFFNFTFYNIKENDEKVFRWKLFHNIIPNQILLKKWNLTDDDKCYICKKLDTYEHYFLDCTALEYFWNRITNTLTILGYSKPLNKLKYVVLGYKSCIKEYNDINILLSLIGFTIYKWFHVSNQRRGSINIFALFRNEIDKKLWLKFYKNNKFLLKFKKLFF